MWNPHPRPESPSGRHTSPPPRLPMLDASSSPPTPERPLCGAPPLPDPRPQEWSSCQVAPSSCPLSDRSACLFLEQRCCEGQREEAAALSQETPEGRGWVSPPGWGFPEGRGCVSLLSSSPLQARPFPALRLQDFLTCQPEVIGVTGDRVREGPPHPPGPARVKVPAASPPNPPALLGSASRYLGLHYSAVRLGQKARETRPWPPSQKCCEAAVRHL